LDHLGASGRNNESGASGFSKRTEEISSHTGNITNIVTDIIGNSSGVQWRVFFKSNGNFSSKISTNVSGFGVNTTSNTTEKSNS